MRSAVATTIATTATAATGTRRARTGPGYASTRGRRRELRLGRRLRRRVPRLPVQLQHGGLRAARDSGRREARTDRRQRARRGRDGRSGRARRARRDRRGAQRARPLSRSALARGLARAGRVARLLAEEARVPRRMARPAREGGEARGRVRRERRGVRVPRPGRRAGAPRAAAHAELARTAVPAGILAALAGAGALVPTKPPSPHGTAAPRPWGQ